MFPKALSVLNNDVIPYTPPVDHDRMVNSSVFKSTNQSCLNRQTVIKLAKKSKWNSTNNVQHSVSIANLIVQCSSCNSAIHCCLNHFPSTAALRRSRFPLTSPHTDCSDCSGTDSGCEGSWVAQLTLKRLGFLDRFPWTLTSAPRAWSSLLVRIPSILPSFQWELRCPSSWTKTRSPTETKLDPLLS